MRSIDSGRSWAREGSCWVWALVRAGTLLHGRSMIRSGVCGRSSIDRYSECWRGKKRGSSEYPGDGARLSLLPDVRGPRVRRLMEDSGHWWFTQKPNVLTLKKLARCYLPANHINHVRCPDRPVVINGYWWSAMTILNGTSGEVSPVSRYLQRWLLLTIQSIWQESIVCPIPPSSSARAKAWAEKIVPADINCPAQAVRIIWHHDAVRRRLPELDHRSRDDAGCLVSICFLSTPGRWWYGMRQVSLRR